MLHHNFTLRVSTGVYGSRILSSIYIYILTLGTVYSYTLMLSSHYTIATVADNSDQQDTTNATTLSTAGMR